MDVTFAALSAIILFPDGFGGRALNEESKIKLSDLTDPTIIRDVAEARATRAGQFAMRIYKEYRFAQL